MGKKGDLLRQQKKQSARYVFTGEQLAEHNERVREEYKKSIWDRLMVAVEAEDRKRNEKVEAHARAVWDEQSSNFKTGDVEQDALNYMRYLFAVSCRVLIEQFHWTLPKGGGRKTNIEKFGEALVGELKSLMSDDSIGVIEYARQTKEKYGFEFCFEGETEAEDKGVKDEKRKAGMDEVKE